MMKVSHVVMFCTCLYVCLCEWFCLVKSILNVVFVWVGDPSFVLFLYQKLQGFQENIWRQESISRQTNLDLIFNSPKVATKMTVRCLRPRVCEESPTCAVFEGVEIALRAFSVLLTIAWHSVDRSRVVWESCQLLVRYQEIPLYEHFLLWKHMQ